MPQLCSPFPAAQAKQVLSTSRIADAALAWEGLLGGGALLGIPDEIYLEECCGLGLWASVVLELS